MMFTKKQILILILISVFFVYSGCDNDDPEPCATKYPIVLSHGMGAQQDIAWGLVHYWNDIPEALEEQGAEVYITSVNAMDATENKALQWQKQVLEILAISGAGKINLIGHSHGCIYSRYAMSNLNMGNKVASHTSIAGPHRGSVVADKIMDLLPDWLEEFGGPIVDWFFSFLMGDVDGNSVQNGYDLVRDYMENTFNPNTPDVAGIYYQSWAFSLRPEGFDIMRPFYNLMLPYEGDNDGLVSVYSAQWGNFRGTMYGPDDSSGIDHLEAVGLLLKQPGFDHLAFYIDVVSELKNMGF